MSSGPLVPKRLTERAVAAVRAYARALASGLDRRDALTFGAAVGGISRKRLRDGVLRAEDAKAIVQAEIAVARGQTVDA